MQKIYISVLIVLVSYTLQAQQVVTILDSDSKEPISDVNIKVKGIDKGFATNHNGVFTINNNDNLKNTSILIISHINYYPEEITLKTLTELDYTLNLLKNTSSLDEIIVSGKKKKLKTNLQFNEVTTMPKSLSNFDAFISNEKFIIIGGIDFNKSDSWNEMIVSKDKVNELGPTLLQVLQTMPLEFDWEKYNTKIYEYNYKKNNWSINDIETINRAFHNVHVYNNKAYIVGGKRLSKSKNTEYLENRIEILDLKNNSITIDKVNPHKAANFASFLYKDNLIVMGGSTKMKPNGNKVFSNEVHYQNLTTGLWYNIGSMPIPKETQGVLIEDIIYLVGGNDYISTKNIESFNVTTGRWKKEGEMFKDLSKPAVVKNNHIIYIFENGQFLTYNTLTRRLNQYKIDLGLFASKLLLKNNELFILGGYYSKEYSEFTSDKVYSVNLNEFQNTKIIKTKIL